jgi:hypothetical protein
VPVPISPALQAMLSAAKITVQFQPASTTPTSASAPALVITMPADVTQLHLGTGPGYLSITVGAATATLHTGGVANPGAAGALPVTGGTAGGAAASTSGSGTATAGVTVGAGSSGTGVAGVGAPGGGLTGGLTGDGTAITSPAGNPAGGPAIAPAPGLATASSGAPPPNPSTFDIAGLYLIVVAGAAAALVISQLTRHLGVRRPWTSSAG